MLSNITTVFIIFSNHLDIGYTDNKNGSCAAAVINRYFHDHFPKVQCSVCRSRMHACASLETHSHTQRKHPQAIKTANESRLATNASWSYRWMTQSWLVDAFHHCETTKVNRGGPTFPNDVLCPSNAAIAEFDAAVRRGDIGYHALPFNAEPEMMTPALFDAALNLTFRVDDLYAHAHRRTVSQRDVPGLTRAALPLLVKRGVAAVSVGENGACAPVAVPPIFRWRDNATDAEVIAMFHAFGYGRRRRRRRRRLLEDASTCVAPSSCMNDVTVESYVDTHGDVVVKGEPGEQFSTIHVDKDGVVHASRSEHCVSVEAAGVALCYAWRIDNTGPHNFIDASIIVDAVRLLFPGAHVDSSDAFDDFIQRVIPVKDTLPLVTAEIGDTWIYGASADPLKVALFRAASRAYGACMNGHTCVDDMADEKQVAALRTFERILMVNAEHTWGWNGGDLRRNSWKNENLAYSLAHDRQFQTAVVTWLEQRTFVRNAVAALPPHSPLATAISKEFDTIEGDASGKPYGGAGFIDAKSLDASVLCGIGGGDGSRGLQLQFRSDGAIVGLYDTSKAPPKKWADAAHPLAVLAYWNGDHEYFRRMMGEQYIASIEALWPGVLAENLMKPNLDLPSMNANATLTRLRVSSGDDKKSTSNQRVLIDMTMPTAVHTERGAPSTLQAMVTCSRNSGTGDVELSYELRWFNKTKTHAPETIWLSHRPITLPNARVFLDKMGSTIDAEDADLGCGEGTTRTTCGVHLHGVGDGGVRVVDKESGEFTNIASLDSALVSVGTANPVPPPLRPPNLAAPNAAVHFALVGNIWNTNYPVWYPFAPGTRDAASQFRFKLTFGCESCDMTEGELVAVA